MLIWKISRARKERRNIEHAVPVWTGHPLNQHPRWQRWHTDFPNHDGVTIQKGDRIHIELDQEDVRRIIDATTIGVMSQRLTSREAKTFMALAKKLYGTD